jgi:hypothetical protein
VEPGAEYEALRERIVEQLGSFRDPSSGRLVVGRVIRREAAMPGPFADRAPDLLVEMASWEGYRLQAAPSGHRDGVLVRKLRPAEQIDAKGTGTSGVHLPEGILVAAGPSVRGRPPAIPDLVDIFPTAASALGLAIPSSLDGKTIPEISPQPSQGQATPGGPGHPVASAYTPEEEAILRKRLEGLGYL